MFAYIFYGLVVLSVQVPAVVVGLVLPREILAERCRARRPVSRFCRIMANITIVGLPAGIHTFGLYNTFDTLL